MFPASSRGRPAALSATPVSLEAGPLAGAGSGEDCSLNQHPDQSITRDPEPESECSQSLFLTHTNSELINVACFQPLCLRIICPEALITNTNVHQNHLTNNLIKCRFPGLTHGDVILLKVCPEVFSLHQESLENQK